MVSTRVMWCADDDVVVVKVTLNALDYLANGLLTIALIRYSVSLIVR